MVYDFEEFGKYLKSLRKFQNKTLEDVAYQSGISISTIQAIENNKRDPSFETIEILSYCYGLDLFNVLSNYKNSIFDKFHHITNNIDNSLDKYEYETIEYEINKLDELAKSYQFKNNPNFSNTVNMYKGIYHLQYTQNYDLAMEFCVKVLDGKSRINTIPNLNNLTDIHKRTIMNIASLYTINGEISKANELLIFLINNNTTSEINIKSFINMGHNYFYLNEYDKIISVCEHGIKKSIKYNKFDKLVILFWLYGASNIELNNKKIGSTYITNSLYLSEILCTKEVENNFKFFSKEYYNIEI